jgi:superoxide dismutase
LSANLHASVAQILQPPTAQTNSTNNTQLPADLLSAIDGTWGSFPAFKENLTAAALGVFGSGWAWLTVNPANGKLAIETTPNQDTTLAKALGYSGNVPILVRVRALWLLGTTFALLLCTQHIRVCMQ